MTNKQREFMGFLVGEGCFRIAKNKRGWKSGSDYMPQISIAQRSDSIEILKWAQIEYGGYLATYQPQKTIHNQNPYSVWQIKKTDQILRVVDHFLQIELPNNKRKQAEILKEFCLIKKSHADKRNAKKYGLNKKRYYSDEEVLKFEAFFISITSLKKFK